MQHAPEQNANAIDFVVDRDGRVDKTPLSVGARTLSVGAQFT
jgi:hypothetical protein